MSKQRNRSASRSEAQRQVGKGCAKSAVMQPEYRMRTERLKTRYGKQDRKQMKKALKQGLYSFWELIKSASKL